MRAGDSSKRRGLDHFFLREETESVDVPCFMFMHSEILSIIIRLAAACVPFGGGDNEGISSLHRGREKAQNLMVAMRR